MPGMRLSLHGLLGHQHRGAEGGPEPPAFDPRFSPEALARAFDGEEEEEEEAFGRDPWE